MKQTFLVSVLLCLCACQMQQAPQNPQFGNAKVYTTPGGVGGVSYTKYEVTPL
jgi:hypothetical protein